MSKCREGFEEHFAGLNLTREILGKEIAPFYYYAETQERWEDWQAAWNARGKVDAEIARTPVAGEQDDITMAAKDRIAEAIEKENEQ